MYFNEETLTTCAPIRKPQSRKYKIRSHRKIALKSMDRLLMLGGRLHWVEGDNSFENISKVLKKMAVDGWKKLPKTSPRELELFSKREVTSSSLNKLSYSVMQWSTAIERDSIRARSAGEARGQQRELQGVLDRHEFLFTQLRAGGDELSRIVLDPKQETSFEAMFRRVQHVAPVWNPQLKNLARFVFWCGGSDAFHRFTTAMNRAPRTYERYQRQIRRAILWTESLERRLHSESKLSVSHDFEHNDLNNELHEWMEERGLKYSVKGKMRSRLSMAVANYRKAERLVAHKMDVMLPATIAASAICVRSGNELIQKFIDDAFASESPKENSLVEAARTQIAMSGCREFPDVVRMVNAGELPLVSRHKLWKVRRFIEEGNHVDDIRFVLNTEMAVRFDVRLKPVRIAAQRFDRLFGGRTDVLQSHEIFSCVMDAFQIKAADQVVRWLELFPREVFTRGLTERTTGVLQTLFHLSGMKAFQKPIAQRLTTWSCRSQQVRDCFENEREIPRDLRSWLRRLTYFQRLAGAEVRIPSSLKKLLEGPKRAQKEREHLTKLEDSGVLNHKQSCRLNSLREKPFDQQRFEKQAILLTMELCVLSAIESLRTLMSEGVKQVWTEVAGTELPADWSEQRCEEFAKWAVRMEPCQKGLLRDVMSVWTRYGSQGKSKLPWNSKWIEQQRSAGFRIDHWLQPETSHFDVGGNQYRIEVAHDPFQVFLMGTLFSTCLAQDGCNEMSVLANAAHANKQVIYVRDDKNKVVARKLIAMSRENGLLGYNLYVQSNVFETDKDLEQLKLKVLSYCNQIAIQVGLKLSNDGSPMGLGHFWYDDDTVDWTKQE